MDNKTIDLTSVGKADMQRVLDIMCTRSGYTRKVTHYAVIDRLYDAEGDDPTSRVKTLVLLDGPEGQSLPLPTNEQAPDALISFVQDWLANAPEPPEDPHFDGGLDHGWRAFTDRFGFVDTPFSSDMMEYRRAVVAFQPAWAYYGS